MTEPSAERLAGAMGLCRRAGALLYGSDRVCEAVQAGKARLVLLTSDASPRTQSRVQRLCGAHTPCRTIPLTAARLAALTPRPAAVFAVTDTNLARLCAKHLEQTQSKEGSAYGL